MSVKQQAFSAVRWTTLSMLARAGVQVGQLAILARLLAPADFGLMAMAGVVLSFATLFADLGLNSAYIQRQGVTAEQRASLFWVSVIAGTFLCVVLLLASSLFAQLLGDERLTGILALASTTFVFSALAQQLRSNSEKTLDFRPIVLIEIAGSVLGFVAAVGLSLTGFGVYSLVWGGVVSTGSIALLSWMFLAGGWRPQWRCRFSEVRSYLGFGSAALGANLVNHFNVNIDLLLGGRLLGAAALGLYSMPRSLILQAQMMINPIVTRVGFPLIAQVQRDHQQVRSIFLKTLNMTSSVNAPLYLGVAIYSAELVRVLLGAGWIGTENLLQTLALWGFVRSTANPAGSLVLGMGYAKLALKWNLVLMLILPATLWASSQFGTKGLAWALLGTSVALFVPGWRVLVWPLCRATLADYSVVVLRPAAIAAAAIVPCYLLTGYFESPALRLVIGGALSALLYCIVSYRLNREWTMAVHQLVLKK